MSLTQEQLLDRLGLALEETLAVNRHMLARLEHVETMLLASATGGVSSVELEQGAKEVRLTVKVYKESAVREVGDEAVAEFGRLFCEVERQQANGWRETVKGGADGTAQSS